ncbi:MAG: hypothetical protein MJ250_07230 [Alphaproteobacteria bacterium]|nr:hypothetical protein [Alphaproteobacteria bacterium]
MADIYTMFVCENDGTLKDEIKGKQVKLKIIGKEKEKDLSYTFFAGKNWNEATKCYDKGSPSEITYTMPVGGDKNGQFRFPHYGEKILVIQQGNSFFLMSYLPGSQEPFFSQDELKEYDDLQKANVYCVGKYNPHPKDKSKTEVTSFESESMATASKIEYSTQKTLWKKEADDKNYPELVQLNVSSTGDIHTTAGNYNEINARRIGIFSGVNLNDFKENKDENDGFMKLPFDNPDAEPSFQQGDIQIRANKRLVLKAGEGIDIQCGRSIISIDDTGIQIKSAKIDPTYKLDDDSVIILSSRTGVDVSGCHLNLNAGIKYSISERMGGNISSMAGITSIESPNLQLGSCSIVDASLSAANHIFNWAEQGIILEKAKDRRNSIDENIKNGTEPEDKNKDSSNIVPYVEKAGSTIASIAHMFNAHALNNGDDNDKYGIGVLDLGSGIVNLLFTVKDAIMSNMDIKHKTDAKYRSEMALVDYNVSLSFVTLLMGFAVYDEVRGYDKAVYSSSIKFVAGAADITAGTVEAACGLSKDDSICPMVGLFHYMMSAAAGITDIVSLAVNENTTEDEFEELKTL